MAKYQKQSSSEAGVSLLAVAIGMILTAFVIGGIIFVVAIVGAAQTRKIVSKREDVTSMLRTFQLKYNAMPGDMNNARMMLGCTFCNGNGDGEITWASGEGYKVWSHLSLAKLYPGEYPGNGAYAIPGKNVPQFSPVGYDTGFYVDFVNAGTPFKASRTGAQFLGLYIGFGKSFTAIPNLNTPLVGPAFDTEEAFELDIKTDDGFPLTGDTRGWNKAGCFIVLPDVTNGYDFNADGINQEPLHYEGCMLAFKIN